MGAQCCAPLQDYDLTLPCSVTVNQLQSFMDEKLTNLKILDCTQKLTRYDDSKDCFMKQSIPGYIYKYIYIDYIIYELTEYRSMFLDMRVLQNEPNSTSKNTLPSLPYFISHMEILGIKTSDKIVLYAQNRKSIPFAHRARYIFKAFNHNDVLLLDGSLENWIDVGYSTASGLILHNVNPKRSAYKYKPNQTILASLQDVIFSISDNFDGIQILDARKMNFYEKSMKNPPKGRTIGKIPTAIHFDAFECFETDGTLKNRVEITSLYQIKGNI